MPFHNRKYLLERRKALRSNLTPSEAKLWKVLKGKKLQGRKFRRQQSIGNYIVDFYCPTENLVIEIDGAQHLTPSGEMSDQERDAFLQSLNLRVIRIPNEVIHHKLEIAVEMIVNAFLDT
jgi:very-short-patch-repair endonuclease